MGGAGLAARRLHQQLLSDGIQSEFYCLERSNFHPGENEYSISRSRVRKFFSKVAVILNEKLTKQIHFSIFSTNAARLDFFRSLSLDKTRVLHFHNWQNLISQKSLLKLISEGFPVVLTLHDERIVTGGCHYRLDCTENERGCRACPRANKILHPLIRSNRKNIRAKLQNPTISLELVSPSEWLKTSIVSSKTYDPNRVYKILNPLGPEWNPKNYKFSYNRNATSKTRVGIATMSDSFVKHGELLNNLLSDPQFLKDFEIVYLRDYPQHDSELSTFWKEIEILLAISRADNSPNSIIEARSLGIPVLSSKVGGIPEILGGIDIALDENEHNVSDIIEKLWKIKSLLQTRVSSEFDLKVKSSEDFTKLYDSLLNHS